MDSRKCTRQLSNIVVPRVPELTMDHNGAALENTVDATAGLASPGMSRAVRGSKDLNRYEVRGQ
jgi:hypothetical protein